VTGVSAVTAGLILAQPRIVPRQSVAVEGGVQVMTVLSVGTVLGFTGAGIGTLIGVYVPQLKKSRRAREIDLLLPDAISFMYSLSVGGMNQVEVMKALAKADDTYETVSEEFTAIVYQMTYFNVDYQTAIEEVAETTPSDELRALLTDMLSVVNSGGDITEFLETRQDQMRDKAKTRQESMLDTIELFGHMYMTLNILPLGLLIVFVVMGLMGSATTIWIGAVVYGIIPGLNLVFGILLAVIKQDEIGDGHISPPTEVYGLTENEMSFSDYKIINQYRETGHQKFFSRIRSAELRHRIARAATSPWEFFRLRPQLTIVLTVPIAIMTVGALIATGNIRLSRTALVTDAYTQTIMLVYVPLLIVLTPLALFYEWNRLTQGEILDTLTEDIRKLSNANETGQPVIESLLISAQGNDSRLTDEFLSAYKKTRFGVDLSAALIALNNKYARPRLARVIKLINKAQEASSNITEVLTTAATTSQYQDELQSSRIQRTRMQVAIIAVSFLVILMVFVMMDGYFLAQMVEGLEQQEQGNSVFGNGGTSLEPTIVSMLFFHAVTLQALFAGGISGYMQTAKIKSSYKYIVAYLLLAGVTWGVASAVL